ncbi:Possibl zinc metallo-peptidase [Rhodobacteraceae bacterium THAF1]|uniref:metallopeptidase family protein n=1 Tax=Palleronia sp. THAF1 TaxID=2587842 RepID=UPI000F413F92|nr:metallopeptidase family protein [Palleronia sp. THAF1]QFU09509.1 Possibl zinc metallo-peptidase [Palleronia sp. THAF1]VDC21810.1 Possibl zinc metallo-peptidase [Rhodobacteraceae bacterium THAF1]
MNTTALTAPDLADIERLALAARDALSPDFKRPAMQVALRVEDFADEDMLDELELENAFQLTGMYEGIPLIEKSSFDQPMRPDTIWLFRRPILDEWAERGDVTLGALVSHVYIHELAHHFGWSDADIARIDRWWE